jgi:serine O-acetyltransferase
MIILKCDFEKKILLELLQKQLSNFFIIERKEFEVLAQNFDVVYEKLSICLDQVENKYFKKGGTVYFNPYHSGQYLIFLYFFSNVCSNKGEKCLADKIYYLNKIMHACDIYP